MKTKLPRTRAVVKILIILLLPAITGCDCLQQSSGVIFDKMSGIPLPGASVYFKSHEYESSTTDSCGRFMITGITGGLSSDCRHMMLVVSCRGYLPTEMPVNNGDSVSIGLVPEAGLPDSSTHGN